MTADELSKRLMEFAVRVLRVVGALPKRKVSNHCAGQLLPCGTSAGANYEEARAAESREDFVHKCQIVLKELRETGYWLHLIGRMGLVDSTRLSPLLGECNELVSIFTKSVSTAKSAKPSSIR